ncbi:hypothetical protein D623_10006856 [Myotis brandtii]|uniref:Uncharacterized protein n=1 Tax=Myotis brandtii TaxID=109478 RepID=S7PD72_MYOBR|nr:hypothetical protein D623_10006856 [Myotis brandtii]
MAEALDPTTVLSSGRPFPPLSSGRVLLQGLGIREVLPNSNSNPSLEAGRARTPEVAWHPAAQAPSA